FLSPRLHIRSRSSFSFHATAPSEIYTLSLHDALPIFPLGGLDFEEIAELLEGSRRLGEPLEVLPRLLRTLGEGAGGGVEGALRIDRKSTRLNSSHVKISYAVFCLKKKKKTRATRSDRF